MLCRIDQTPDGARIRAVLAPGGFGVFNPAAPTVVGTADLLTSQIPVVNEVADSVVGYIVAVESQLRGAAAWWVLLCAEFGYKEQAAEMVLGERLAKASIVGDAKSLSLRRIARLVLFIVAVLVAAGVIIGLFVQ